MTTEEEITAKQNIRKIYSKDTIRTVTDAVSRHQVNSSYYETMWLHGISFLHELTALGYKVVPIIDTNEILQDAHGECDKLNQ